MLSLKLFSLPLLLVAVSAALTGCDDKTRQQAVRLRPLNETGAVSRQSFDEAIANARQAAADVAHASEGAIETGEINALGKGLNRNAGDFRAWRTAIKLCHKCYLRMFLDLFSG